MLNTPSVMSSHAQGQQLRDVSGGGAVQETLIAARLGRQPSMMLA
jgi:hypothetical protein